jgi:4-amino-4-deoxy-L-arabinose transferase-like glycosyltransferase
MLGMWQDRRGHYLLLIAAGLILFMNNLGGPSLWDLDEGRNATASLEMLESGDYIVPTFNAQLRVDKPILLYWLQVGSYRLFGINEFAARLPSALAASGVLLIGYELGRALYGTITGFLGALILGSTAMMVGAGRFANPDAALNFFVALTLLIFWRGLARPTSSWFATLGILFGCAALTKGPVGVMLPILVMVSFLTWEKRLAVLWDRRLLWGVLAMALVALPWYIWVAVETRGLFLRGFLGEHNLSRFFQPMDRHAGSPLYYPLVLLIGLAPWSIVLALASWFGFWSMVRKPWPRAAAWWGAARDRRDRRLPAARCLGGVLCGLFLRGGHQAAQLFVADRAAGRPPGRTVS